MKCGVIVRAVGCIDGALIDEAENYRPKRRMPTWIWAASAACLCVVVFFAARYAIRREAVLTNDSVGVWVIAGEAVNGYVDYREQAQTGKVLITDELKDAMIRSKEIKDCESIMFQVRIIDANGAGNDVIASVLGLREEFIRDGTVTLSEDEINAIKGVPGMALIITTEYIAVNDKYLNTAGRDTLDVEVIIKLDYDWLHKQYKGGDATEYWEWRDNYVLERVTEYAKDYGIDIDREVWAGFWAELDIELISRLLQDERTDIICVSSF